MKWSYTKLELYEKWSKSRDEVAERIRVYQEREKTDVWELKELLVRRNTLDDMLADIFEVKVDPVTLWRDTTFERSRDLFTKAGLYAKWELVSEGLQIKAAELFEELKVEMDRRSEVGEAVVEGAYSLVDEIEAERELCYVQMNVISVVMATIGLLYDGY